MSLNPETTFPLFDQLPAELRLKIWTFAVPLEPRVHPMLKEKGRTFVLLLRGQPLPALLHACRDSRDVFLSIIRPRFDVRTYVNDDGDPVYHAVPFAGIDVFRKIKGLGREGGRTVLDGGGIAGEERSTF